MSLESLQEPSCEVMLAGTLIHNKLGDPPNDTWVLCHENVHTFVSTYIPPSNSQVLAKA